MTTHPECEICKDADRRKAGLELGVVDTVPPAGCFRLRNDGCLPDGDDDSYWIETNRMVIVHLNHGVYV